MAKSDPQQPLVVVCELCQERNPTSRAQARYVAVDHLLDEHLAELRRHADKPQRLYRVITPAGKAARLAPTP